MGGAIDNPFRVNDAFNLTYRATDYAGFSDRYSKSSSFLYSIPFGYFTFSTSHLDSSYSTPISIATGANGIVAEGDSKNTTLSTEYVAYRGRKSRLAFAGTLIRKKSENYLASQFLSVSSRRLSVFDFGSSLSTVLWGGNLNFGIGHSWGLKAFDALEDVDNLPSFAPRAQFRKWTTNISWHKSFMMVKQNFGFNTSVRGQAAQDALYGSEQFLVGGFYSVRGYRNQSISGGSGFAWRNDLAINLPFEVDKTTFLLKPYISYDFGSIRKKDSSLGGRMTGMAVGVGLSNRHINLDVAYTRPLTMPSRLKNEGEQVFARLTINI